MAALTSAMAVDAPVEDRRREHCVGAAVTHRGHEVGWTRRPTRGDDGHLDARRDRAEQVSYRSPPVPVPVDRRDQQLARAEIDRAERPVDRVETGRSRPPLTTTSHEPRRQGPRAVARRAMTTAWRPKRDAHRLMRAGSATAAVLSDTLSAPARRTSRISSTVRTPPPTVSGMNARRAVRSTMSRSVPRRSGAAADVEEDELVGALCGVALGEFRRDRPRRRDRRSGCP